jgi:hypothetical protein
MKTRLHRNQIIGIHSNANTGTEPCDKVSSIPYAKTGFKEPSDINWVSE